MVVLGHGKAGKTTLLHTLRGSKFSKLASEIHATEGVGTLQGSDVFGKMQVGPLGPLDLQVFDFAGQQEYSAVSYSIF